MVSSVKGGSAMRLRAPASRANSRANESPPGKPREPSRRTALMSCQSSSGASATGPLLTVGQAPVRWWWAFAQRRKSRKHWPRCLIDELQHCQTVFEDAKRDRNLIPDRAVACGVAGFIALDRVSVRADNPNQPWENRHAH